MGETVTITKIEYERLLDCEMKLLCLEGQGVDNWVGWGDAMDEYQKYKDEK